MRKEILDFIKAESRPNQHERNDDPRELMWAIVDIYKQRKADAITLQNDLEALVFESRLHKNYKDASILVGLNPQQTENDHETALFDVNNCIDYLIMTAKKWGVTLPESVIQKYDCMNYGRDYTLADFIRWQYGTNTKKTSLDNLNDPEKLAKAVKLLEQMLLDQNDNDVSENEQPADTSTPEQTPLDKLLEEWNAPGIKKRVLIQLEKNGLATKNGKVYNWKIDNDNDYPNNLYVYFVYIASDKFGWRLGKNKDRIPWNKFNPLFPNMANNQNALNQYLIEIKNGIFPRRATEIDDIVK